MEPQIKREDNIYLMDKKLEELEPAISGNQHPDNHTDVKMSSEHDHSTISCSTNASKVEAMPTLA